jgi:hypothetical protein
VLKLALPSHYDKETLPLPMDKCDIEEKEGYEMPSMSHYFDGTSFGPNSDALATESLIPTDFPAPPSSISSYANSEFYPTLGNGIEPLQPITEHPLLTVRTSSTGTRSRTGTIPRPVATAEDEEEYETSNIYGLRSRSRSQSRKR